MASMTYNFKESLWAGFKWIKAFTPEEVTIRVFWNKKPIVFSFDKVSNVRICPSFLRDDECIRCGKCCGGFYLIFTESFSNIDVDSVEVEVEVIRGSKTEYSKIYVVDARKGCPFLKYENGKAVCTIHGRHPIHCQMPHRVFYIRDGITYLMKRPYTRAKYCKARLLNKYTLAGRKADLEVLRNLSKFMNDLKLNDELVRKTIAKINCRLVI